jgi:4-amino-4-deoxy-L-arabinose transferase-like glycosyltransferase
VSGFLSRETRGHFLLLLLTLALLVVPAGRAPLFEPDEGRYAEIPREMLATGDFVTPRLNGVLYFEKPPLFYWAVAASFRLFGTTELAARLPGQASSVVMVLMAAAFASRRWGARTGLLAGVVTGGSVLVFAMARVLTIDPMLSCALAGAAFAFASFQEAEQKGDGRRARVALWALVVACAAAVMLKGLIGVVLPGGAILVFAALSGRWRLVPKLLAPGPLLLFLLLVVPWHLEMARRHPDFLSFYFVHEHVDRFARTGHHREGSPLYFAAVLLAGFVPWTGFFSRLRETLPLRRDAFRERGTESFLWTWALLVFLFFSVSRSKLIPYLEPIWPALAVLLAVGIEKARLRGARFTGMRRATAVLFGALLAAGIAWGIGAGFLADWDSERVGLAALAALLLGFSLNVSPGLFERFARRSGGWTRVDPVPWVALPWAAFLVGAILLLPAAARRITPWRMAEVAVRELAPGDLLVQRGGYLQSIPFYAKRTTPIALLGDSELDFGRTREGSTGIFLNEGEFRALWNGPKKVLAVVQTERLRDFSDPKSGLVPARELARVATGKFVLLSNR